MPAEFWDDRRGQVRHKHENSAQYNQIIENARTAAQNYILDCQIRKVNPDPQLFLHGVKYGEDVIGHLTVKMESYDNYRTRGKFQTCINFIKDAGLNRPLKDVDQKWVVRLDKYLRSLGHNDNTRSKHITNIKSVFLKAHRTGLILSNPFMDWHKSSTPGVKAKLTMDEFNRISSARFTGYMEDVRRFFVLSTLCRGMRAFDALTLTWADISDTRIVYITDKRPKGKEGIRHDIEITAPIRAVLDMLGRGSEYVFPFVLLPKSVYNRDNPKSVELYKRHVDSVLVQVNEELKRIAAACSIDKRLSTHVNRHSFASIMRKRNVDLVTIQNLLGHSDISTTKHYIEELDQADELDLIVKDIWG